MFVTERQRKDRSRWETSKWQETSKPMNSGTLSPILTTTSSSGYSTGDSTISTGVGKILKNSSSSSSMRLKKSQDQHNHCHYQQQQQQHLQESSSNGKTKGLQHLFSKLKTLLLTPKTKSKKRMRSTLSREISSSNILRQYQPTTTFYEILPSTMTSNKTISLPFTYYHDSPIQKNQKNFHEVSAWLKRQGTGKQNQSPIRFNDLEEDLSTSATKNRRKEISVVMKQMSTSNIKPAKRSSSLVTKLVRAPMVEQQKINCSTSSFSSSILTRGMSERVISPSETSDDASNFVRNERRSNKVDKFHEQNENKENFFQTYSIPCDDGFFQVQSILPADGIYSTTSNKFNNVSDSSENNEDFLNNSYGLTLLKERKLEKKDGNQRKRHSLAPMPLLSAKTNLSTTKTSTIIAPSLDSLDDLLCDREVESYFYPKSASFHSDHFYTNSTAPSDQYYLSSSTYIHGTLC